MTNTVEKRFEELSQRARASSDALHGGKSRVTVQVGHCSTSVGAHEVADALVASIREDAYVVVAGCDGACFAAPKVLVNDPSGATTGFARVNVADAESIAHDLRSARMDGSTDDIDFFGNQHRIGLNACGELDSTDLDDYLLHGGYGGLARALAMAPEEVIEEVEASGLRGRGGAYFPAALKWRGARTVDTSPRYLVVNSEEGEPGVFKDRHLMEGVPHRIIEGTVIAAYASGVSQAFVYINAEADLSAQRVQAALKQALGNGLVGDDILGSGYTLSVEILRGAGGYVCGEETTMLNTMEGYRREPRLRPPFPTEAGLWSKPTVINNAETLASVPFILAEGASGAKSLK